MPKDRVDVLYVIFIFSIRGITMLVPYRGKRLYVLTYPKSTPIITSGDYENGNAMAASWHTYLSFDPPLYGISIAPKRYTYRLIKKYGEFAVNFVSLKLAGIVWKVGNISGSEIDKFEEFGIKKVRGRVIRAPLLADSIAVLECKLVDTFRTGDHEFFVGEIVFAWIKEKILEKGTIDLSSEPLYYWGEGKFVTIDKDSIRMFR